MVLAPVDDERSTCTLEVSAVIRHLFSTLALALAATSLALASDSSLLTEPQTVLIAGQVSTDTFHVGAGVIIRAQGSLTIVTAAHVLQGTRAITVETATGEHLDVLGEPRFIDGHDLVLIRTALPIVAGIHVATPADTVTDNATLYVWGHPHSNSFVRSDASFLTTRVTGGAAGLFAIRCPSCAVGDSGGGVFDEQGRLLGIVTSRQPDTPTLTAVVIAESIAPALAAAGIDFPIASR